MLFIDNKYTRTYYKIIFSASNRTISNDIYTEIHHIIPKSFGGSDEKINLIRLTAKEHFVCHHLLIKMINDKNLKAKAYKALERMTVSNNSQYRYKISARLYEKIRKDAAISHSILISGTKRSPHSEETKQKMRDTAISQKRNGENNPFYGKKHTTSAISKMKGPRPNFVPHNKGKTGFKQERRDYAWKIINNFTNEIIIVPSLSRWAKENNYNPSSVGSAVKNKAVWQNFHIEKLYK